MVLVVEIYLREKQGLSRIYIVSIMAGDVLGTRGARGSAAMAQSVFQNINIPVRVINIARAYVSR